MTNNRKKEERDPADEEEKKDYREVLKEEHSKKFKKKLKVELSGKLSWNEIARPEVVYVTTGHGPFNEYLRRFGAAEEGTCRLCMEQDETIEHFQDGCPALEYKLPTKLKTRNEMLEFEEQCVDLVSRLRNNK